MLTRWNNGAWPAPWLGDPLHEAGPFGDLRRHMDRVFEELDRRAPITSVERGSSRLSLHDAGEALEVEAEVPGFRREDLDIQIERNTLTIRGRRELAPPEGYVARRRERGAIEIARAFTLPSRIDAEKATAKLEDGVLRLTLPKIAAEQPRRVEVKVG